MSAWWGPWITSTAVEQHGDIPWIAWTARTGRADVLDGPNPDAESKTQGYAPQVALGFVVIPKLFSFL